MSGSALITTATVASPQTRSLRATIPNGVVAYLGIEDGDKVEWRMEIMDGKKVVLVRKVVQEPGVDVEKVAAKYRNQRK